MLSMSMFAQKVSGVHFLDKKNNTSSIDHYDELSLLDELTDQSERLASAMQNTFSYTIYENELLTQTAQQCSLREVLITGLRAAEAAVLHNPSLINEVIRRRIELEELDHVVALEEGRSLIILSPTPDAVRCGEMQINGYDQRRQKLMVRIWTKINDSSEIQSTSLSLDQSNYPGMQAIAESLGQSLNDGMGSEEILAQRRHSSLTHQQLIDRIRLSYDDALTEQLGGRWFAGRRPEVVTDALGFIRKQTDLISQHMQQVKKIKNSNIIDKDAELESARYDFAAALDDRMHGKSVTNVADAGSSARDEGREFSPECPVVGGIDTASEQLNKLGFTGIDKEVIITNCPLCDAKKIQATIDRNAGTIICHACRRGVEYCTGKTFNAKRNVLFKNKKNSNRPIKFSLSELISMFIDEAREEKLQKIEKNINNTNKYSPATTNKAKAISKS